MMGSEINRIDSMTDGQVEALFLVYCTGSFDLYAAFYLELAPGERATFDARVNALAYVSREGGLERLLVVVGLLLRLRFREAAARLKEF